MLCGITDIFPCCKVIKYRPISLETSLNVIENFSKISALKDDNKKTVASWIARFKSKKFGNVVSRERF